jgi:hypothetical protein
VLAEFIRHTAEIKISTLITPLNPELRRFYGHLSVLAEFTRHTAEIKVNT